MAARHKRLPPKERTIKVEGPRSEINVTPLVDVCLVLLIIFMVITPLLARGKEVPLPKTRNYVEETDKNQPIIAINGKGEVYFDKDKLTTVVPAAPAAGRSGRAWQLQDAAILRRTLDDAWQRHEQSREEGQESVAYRVFFKGDKYLPYGMVYPVIMEIHEMGVTAVDLGTIELKEQAQ